LDEKTYNSDLLILRTPPNYTNTIDDVVEMTDYDRNKLLEFPCEFPLKVMGKNHEDFEVYVFTTVNRHVGGHLTEAALKSRPSKNGNYASITVTFEAQSQQQIDDIYIELTAHELVLMAL